MKIEKGLGESSIIFEDLPSPFFYWAVIELGNNLNNHLYNSFDGVNNA